jgi:DNA-binding response OmpR family regulator
MHALIIEDEPLIAMGIEDALRDSGYTSFDFATCVEGAVSAASRRCPDLITSDVMLKPGNGIDAVEAICGRVSIPVIFITSSPEQVQERLPAYSVVRKPFSHSDVTAAVHAAAA